MLICTARLTRKKVVLAVLVMGAAIMALILLLGRENPDTTQSEPLPLTTNESRIRYLNELGWEVAPEPVETLQFLLPSRLEGAYLAYNELQDSQGFDLRLCCGKQITRYTYTVTNYPDRPEGVQANLYVCEDQAVAGDICCPGADGFQQTLRYPSQDA